MSAYFWVLLGGTHTIAFLVGALAGSARREDYDSH